METLWQDLRYAIRMLRASASHTAVAGLSLALGIGASTAIFSVVYGVLISPYPYARPNEIWAMQVRDPKQPSQYWTPHRLSEIEEIRKLPAVADLMATVPGSQLLTGGRAPENFTAIQVTGNAFQFLDVPPVLGRTIVPGDVKPGGEPEPVIVLSYKAWQRLFDGNRDALAQSLVLNDQRYTVIGVMPPRFGWWTNDGGWVPLANDLSKDPQVNDIIRLRPGVSKQTAEQQLQSLHTQFAQQRPKDYPQNGFSTVLLNYMDITVASGEMHSSLTLLFAAVGFLLLIACANVANLQLARGTARAREIAVRMSVGAVRSRILRQLLTESVVLSVAGGVAGILFAIAITQGVVALMPEFYVPNEARITVNVYVLLFSAAISVLTGILFGLAPAVQCSRPDLVGVLKEGGRSGADGTAGARTRSLLVVAELMLSVVLLMGASLTVRGFYQLQHVDPGFQPDRVLMFGLPLPPKRYSTYDQRINFTENVLARLQAIPGVQSVAIGNGGLPFGGPQSPYTIEGHPQTTSKPIGVNLISAGYSRTMGIPLRAGRDFEDRDVVHGDPVALINETAAKLWPAGESPIGGRVHLDILDKPRGNALLRPGATATVTVVGIIADTRNAGLRSAPDPAISIPYTLVAPPGRTVAVRTQGQPLALVNTVRQQVQSIDKDQPLGRPLTLEEILGFDTVQPRFNMALFSFFAGLGLALAVVGIYSVVSYMVARRTHEIGIRMALGAERSDVLRLMLQMGGKLILTGLALGMVASFAISKYLRSEVFQVPATDPLSIGGVLILLSAAALFACLVPARKAAALDPGNALRHE